MHGSHSRGEAAFAPFVSPTQGARARYTWAMTQAESEAVATLTPEMIEKLRQTGIRLDREGRLWHEGSEITHAGLRRALLRWMDRLDDGRPIIRLDERRYAYIDVDDAHLLVLSARWQGDRAFVSLNDGSEEELDYGSLQVSPDHVLYCRVRDGRLDARITTPAYYVLAERIAPSGQDGDGDSFVLRACGQGFPLGRRMQRS